jgi:hypothetical protein
MDSTTLAPQSVKVSAACESLNPGEICYTFLKCFKQVGLPQLGFAKKQEKGASMKNYEQDLSRLHKNLCYALDQEIRRKGEILREALR